MCLSKTYCLVLLKLAGLGNVFFTLIKHVMPTPSLPTHLVMKVCQKAAPSVFVISVCGAWAFGELKVHGRTPVPFVRTGLQSLPTTF